MMKWLRGRGNSAAADEIRAARKAAGWTHQQAAEAMGVLPVEVAAWESGAVGLGPHEAAVMRWKMEDARYQASLPRSECYWTRVNDARLAHLRTLGPFSAMRAALEQEDHARECGECMGVQALQRHAPPPPGPPAEPGLRGWWKAASRRIDRLPAWLRIPLTLGELAVKVSVVYLGLQVVEMAGGPLRIPYSYLDFLLLMAGGSWAWYLGARLLPLACRRPWLAGQIHAAGVALPATIVIGLRGGADLAAAGPWVLAGLASVFIGGIIGKRAADAPDDEAKAADAPDDEGLFLTR